MVLNKVMVFITSQMEIVMKGDEIMECEKESGSNISKMEINTMVNGLKDKNMGKEYLNFQMANHMMVIGNMDLGVAKVAIFGLMDKPIKENGKMIK